MTQSNDPAKTAKFLRENKKHVRAAYDVSKDRTARSRILLDKLNERRLVRLVDVTERRLYNYFRRDLKMD